MNQRYTPLQSWERAALDFYARQNHFPTPLESAFWHTYGALLRGALAIEDCARLSFLSVAPGRSCHTVSAIPAVKIENRLYSLFAE